MIYDAEQVLKLPPYVSFAFNPIELIWAFLKGRVAKKNEQFKVNHVKSLLDEAKELNLWHHVVDHTCKESRVRVLEG